MLFSTLAVSLDTVITHNFSLNLPFTVEHYAASPQSVVGVVVVEVVVGKKKAVSFFCWTN